MFGRTYRTPSRSTTDCTNLQGMYSYRLIGPSLSKMTWSSLFNPKKPHNNPLVGHGQSSMNRSQIVRMYTTCQYIVPEKQPTNSQLAVHGFACDKTHIFVMGQDQFCQTTSSTYQMYNIADPLTCVTLEAC